MGHSIQYVFFIKVEILNNLLILNPILTGRFGGSEKLGPSISGDRLILETLNLV